LARRVVRYVVEHAEQQQADRLVEVDLPGQAGAGEDLLRLAEVAADHGDRRAGPADQQRPGVRQRDRVVGHVDEGPGVGGGLAGGLVVAVGDGDRGAELQELADAVLGQGAHGPAGERLGGARGDDGVRPGLDQRLGGVAVRLEMVLATDQVVEHAVRMRDRGVDLRRFPVRGDLLVPGRVPVRHPAASPIPVAFARGIRDSGRHGPSRGKSTPTRRITTPFGVIPRHRRSTRAGPEML